MRSHHRSVPGLTRSAAALLLLLFCLDTSAQQADIMPLPQHLAWNGERHRLDNRFSIAISGNPDPRIYPEASRFLQRLAECTGIFFKTWNVTPADKPQNPGLRIRAEGRGAVQHGMDESYTLEVRSGGVNLTAATDIGAIRGLESILQLIASDDNGYFIRGCRIEDRPRFPWRGLLISQPYHFMPMDVVKRTLDAMALVKMNVLHFYISDDQGYTIESKAYPRLHRMASGGPYFTHEQVREIVAYAAQRGIRVVPEVDLPGHCTAILTAYPELASVKRDYILQDRWGVFDPTMDPTKEQVYRFLDTLLAEVASLFPDEYFHIGGDENTGRDWKRNDSIQRFMKAKGLKSTVALQNHFNRRVQAILAKSGKKTIGWDEVLMQEIDDSTAKARFEAGDFASLVLTDVPKDMVIQSWRGMEALLSSAKNGYRSILSKGYYIDLMQSTAYHYLNDPIPFRNDVIIPDSEANFNRFESEILRKAKAGEKLLGPAEESLILGGEATMWTEHVTPETFDSRVWPRTAAIAERLWSPAEVRDVADMYRRLDIVSIHLESVGSTHAKNTGMMLRRLAASAEIGPLEELLGYLEPLKGYRRNAADNFTKYAPYTQLIDAAVADPKPLRIFNAAIDSLLAHPTPARTDDMLSVLRRWTDLRVAIDRLAAGKPTLAPARAHAVSLAGIASFLLSHPGWMRAGNGLSPIERKTLAGLLAEAGKPRGYCTLGIAESLKRLAQGK
jgi:hexosaminidase